MTNTVMGDLLLIRHAESIGNAARESAESANADVIDIDQRDADVPLTELGNMQAKALGSRLAELRDELAIDRIWISPYERTRATAAIAAEQAGLDVETRVDERLRDRELGIFDRLTSRGIRARYPDEAARRRYLGKLYFRPPSGESWADVALRLRSFLADRDRLREQDGTGHAGGAEIVVTHDAVILLVRYILQRLTEDELMDLARGQSVGNASITWLRPDPDGGPWVLHEFGADEHLERHGAPPTQHGRDRDSSRKGSG
jgi:glucosyl-3-phosphoglycerate phosphatase